MQHSLSALLFILVIDRICKPMVNRVRDKLMIPNNVCLIPPPVLGFADDLALSAYTEDILKEMIVVSEPVLLESGLQVKPSKSALFYNRRSGNNWYKGKNDSDQKSSFRKN